MQSRSRTALVVGLMLLLIGGGSVVLQRDVAETITAALILSDIWAGLVALGFLAYARPRGMLRPVLGALAVGGIVAGFSFWYFSVRDEEVDEDVATASQGAAPAEAEAALSGDGSAEQQKPAGNVNLAAGSFTGADGHNGSGTATVVQEPGGKRLLTFTDFDVSPGAEVEVWLAPDADETNDKIVLGDLKGNVGNQQYEVPADADLNKYGTVILYCTPFTVRIAVAELS